MKLGSQKPHAIELCLTLYRRWITVWWHGFSIPIVITQAICLIVWSHFYPRSWLLASLCLLLCLDTCFLLGAQTELLSTFSSPAVLTTPTGGVQCHQVSPSLPLCTHWSQGCCWLVGQEVQDSEDSESLFSLGLWSKFICRSGGSLFLIFYQVCIQYLKFFHQTGLYLDIVSYFYVYHWMFLWEWSVF
jgi:hypothetical protein